MMTEVIKPFTKAYYEVYNTLLKGGEQAGHGDRAEGGVPGPARPHPCR
jgi:hypothetical protein